MPKVTGYAVQHARDHLTPWTFDRRDPRPHDVAIAIRYCGICHSDIHQARNEWTGDSIYPMVPGHEIAGVVTGVGAAVTRFGAGDPVGVGCFVDSCRACLNCKAGFEQYCVETPTLTYNGRERDGVTPTMGGYSNAIVVDEHYVLRMPDHVPLDAAAPLLCAGITLYSPLRHWKAGPGTRVGLVGLGGLGHMGVKIARAMGAEVTVFSHTPRKRDEAMRLGAHHFHVSSEPEVFTKLEQTFDLVINTVSVAIDWNQYLELVRLDGTMVVVGIPQAPVPLTAQSLLGARRRLAGSAIGSIAETQEMLDFCDAHRIASDIELIPIQHVNEAWRRILASDVRYRFVIDAESLKA
jgi:alcohol dehydrogenase (NADP+)